MKWTECRATRQEIDETDLGGSLSDKTLRHLASCTTCSEFRDERVRLRELVGSLEPITAPADFDVRLRARIAAQQSSTPRPLFAGFALSTPAMAVAVALVIMVIGVVWFAQRGSNPAPAVASGSQSQGTEVKAPATDNGSKPSQETVKSTSGGDEPVYLVRGDRRSPNQFREAGSRVSPGKSSDFSDSAAQSIRQGQLNANEVSVAAPLKPMVLSLEDEKGATRRISLPPVSFGSQRLTESRMVPVSSSSRVW